MPNLRKKYPKVATIAELTDFANKVREAGGGNPLDALMPAVPEDQEQCLIAKNLNFNCEVNTEGPGGSWIMVLAGDMETRDKIAEKLGLKKYDWEQNPGELQYSVILPAAIGRVADEFDNWAEACTYEEYWDIDTKTSNVRFTIDRSNRRAYNRFKRFWPYVEESVREAYENADFVNDKGELIL